MDRHKMISMVIVLLFLSSVISSCKEKNGSGGGGGVTIDNSKAIGTFTGTTLSGTTGFSVDIYTVTFDGAGHGTYSSLSSSASATFNYTVTVPGNDLTIDDTFVGSINSAGNFFTAVDVSSFPSGTNIQMLTGVKKGSGITDNTAITYVGGSLTGSLTPPSPPSLMDLFSVAMHTPLASVLTYTSLTTGLTWTSDYILASDGTFTIDPSSIKPLIGAVSDDKSIMIFTDNFGVACALKQPGSGMTNAKLNGTYKAYRFVGNNVSPAFSASRTTVTFDGNGNGTFQRTADSTGVLGSGKITYTMSPDGTFLIQGTSKGISLADGSVIAYFDDNPSIRGYITMVIAIKQ